MDVPLPWVIAILTPIVGAVGTMFGLYNTSMKRQVEDEKKRADTAEEEASKRYALGLAAAEKRAADAYHALASMGEARLAYVERLRQESEEQRRQLFEMVENLHALGKGLTRGAFGSSPTGTHGGGRGGGGSGPVPTRGGPGTR